VLSLHSSKITFSRVIKQCLWNGLDGPLHGRDLNLQNHASGSDRTLETLSRYIFRYSEAMQTPTHVRATAPQLYKYSSLASPEHLERLRVIIQEHELYLPNLELLGKSRPFRTSSS
jgi:hypothetical protein